MALVVQKYGGTSVADAERINSVAGRVLARQKEGDQLVVVLSARAGETDRLIKLGYEIAEHPDPREMDVLLATGEQTTIALFCIAVKAMGSEAVSMTGPHGLHSNAKQGYGGLLACGKQNVHLTRVGMLGNLVPQLYQPVGFTRTRRKDHNQLVALFLPREDPGLPPN